MVAVKNCPQKIWNQRGVLSGVLERPKIMKMPKKQSNIEIIFTDYRFLEHMFWFDY